MQSREAGQAASPLTPEPHPRQHPELVQGLATYCPQNTFLGLQKATERSSVFKKSASLLEAFEGLLRTERSSFLLQLWAVGPASTVTVLAKQQSWPTPEVNSHLSQCPSLPADLHSHFGSTRAIHWDCGVTLRATFPRKRQPLSHFPTQRLSRPAAE